MKNRFLLFALLLSVFSSTFTNALAQRGPGQIEVDPALQIPATDEGLPGEGTIRRAPWFQNLWNQRRSMWVSQVAQDQGAVVFLGDSITQQWSDDQIGTSFPGLKFANRGISGDTTRGVLIRMDEDVLAVNPSGVVILIGTNDLAEDDTPETIAGNLKLILAKLKEHNADMPIILCRVMPSSESEDGRSPNLIREVNQLYSDLVNGDPQITFVDTYSLFANREGNAKQEEFPDLLHPNEIGYVKWANAIRPILEVEGLLVPEPDDFEPEPGFEMLMNGEDLTGWGFRPISEADIRSRDGWRNRPEWPLITEPESFAGKTESSSGRYVAKNGRIIVKTPPAGRKIEQLWTEREFGGDFILVLEFRATPNADSGVYVRGPQLQCRDYLIAGPYSQLQLYKQGDWNEMVITVKDGVLQATCNGEIIETAMNVPDSGPIGLEGDRGQMEYRRIRIKQLP